jgi:hypothetical protein
MARVIRKKSKEAQVLRALRRIARARKRTAYHLNKKIPLTLLDALLESGAGMRSYKHRSLAGSVKLPYSPESFTVEELQNAINDIRLSRAG